MPASSDGISSWTPSKPQHSNTKPLANQLWSIDFLTPATPLIILHRLSCANDGRVLNIVTQEKRLDFSFCYYPCFVSWSCNDSLNLMFVRILVVYKIYLFENLVFLVLDEGQPFSRSRSNEWWLIIWRATRRKKKILHFYYRRPYALEIEKSWVFFLWKIEVLGEPHVVRGPYFARDCCRLYCFQMLVVGRFTMEIITHEWVSHIVCLVMDYYHLSIYIYRCVRMLGPMVIVVVKVFEIKFNRIMFRV